MKRREFVRSAGLTALGTSLIGTGDLVAKEKVTHLSSEDVSERAALADEFDLHFMAIGDWGRNGEYDQTEVARQMGIWGHDHPNNFVISVGDNFYPKGVISENDPLWNFSYENIYTAHSLQCDWFPVLGNHDYLADPDAQLRYSNVSRRWNMPSRYYSKEFKLGKTNDTVLFVMVDTDPFLFPEKKAYCDTQLVWINDTLSKASANVKWKIVVGHHPYYTVGPRIDNYDTLTMRKVMAGLFEDHKVDVYLSGHDHSLQHLKPEGFTHQFITGAGSELTPVTNGISYSKFQASEHGFMSFAFNSSIAQIKVIKYEGTVLYQTRLKAQQG